MDKIELTEDKGTRNGWDDDKEWPQGSLALKKRQSDERQVVPLIRSIVIPFKPFEGLSLF